MKKIGQFSSVSSGRSSYYAGTTLRFFDMKMKIQLLVASYPFIAVKQHERKAASCREREIRHVRKNP
jgi:hypothetical protein